MGDVTTKNIEKLIHELDQMGTSFDQISAAQLSADPAHLTRAHHYRDVADRAAKTIRQLIRSRDESDR